MERYDIAVVGAGPAGMTAALYAARAGKRVLLLEGQFYGGQIVNSRLVENYPGAPMINGYDLAEQMMSQLRDVGVGVTSGEVTDLQRDGKDFRLTAGKTEYTARAVILATGVTHRKLDVPGEERLIGGGVSFCATCDGMLYRGRDVAVVGGGNTAVQDALVLAELCNRVYLIHRRNEFRAEAGLVAKMKANPKIEVITPATVLEMHGNTRLERLTLSMTESGETRELEVAGVFEAVGSLPKNQAFSNLAALDGAGYLLTDSECQTNVPGIFAAGDCRQKKVRQLTTATADGTVAALAAVEYLDA